MRTMASRVDEFLELARHLESLLGNLNPSPGTEKDFRAVIDESPLTKADKITAHNARGLRNYFSHHNGRAALAEPSDMLMRDLRKLVNRLANPAKLKSLDLPQPICVTPGTPFSDAVHLLVSRDFDQLPIVTYGLPVGLFTLGTVTAAVAVGLEADGAMLVATDVADVQCHWDLTSSVTLHPNSDVLEAMAGLSDLTGGRRKVVLVVDGGKLVGILTTCDYPRLIAAV
jgi:CBS domain-containing protein